MATTSMSGFKKNKTVQVGSNGKAPSGLSSGDKVVTGGGTYEITGVKADGSYESKKVDNTSTYNYSGAYDTAPSTNKPSYNNDYTSTNWDMGLYAKQQMANGASYDDILAIYNDRFKKSMSDPSLYQYADDDIMKSMESYMDRIQASEESQQNYEDRLAELQAQLEGMQQPTYEAKYDPAMMELMNKILSREDFSYDAQSDPLYQQYQSTYQQERDRAMRETLAEAAASAGGMNSYAITAAQQANNYYASQMANKIPELYQLAYQMYLQDKESDVQDLGILQGLDATQYNRYRDAMSDFYTDKNFAYNAYLDDVAQGNWQANFDRGMYEGDRNFNYGASQDNQAQSNWDKTYNDNKAQQELENKRYDDEVARAEAETRREEARTDALTIIASGNMPPANVLEAAGMDEATASALVSAVKAEMAREDSKKSSGGGGGGNPSSPKPKEDDPIYIADGNNNPTEEALVAKAAKELNSPNLTAESLNGMLNMGWIQYDKEEDKFKRTYDFSAFNSGTLLGSAFKGN